jgi:lipopolysaccharide export system permease protein
VRLLDRYLLRELLVPLGYCLSGFLIFWISSDLITNLSEFQKERLTGLEVIEYYLIRLPELLVLVTPVALLLALLYALTNHARHQELTAMRAAGLSLWRICLPYFAVGLLFSAAIYVANEHWATRSEDYADQVRQRHSTQASERGWKTGFNFRNDRHNRFWRIGAFNPETGELRDVYVQWTLPNGGQRQLLAERGGRTNGIWTFTNVRHYFPDVTPDSPPLQQQLDELAVPEFSETPEQIQSEIKISQLGSVRAARKAQLSIREIVNYRTLHPDLTPERRALLDTKLHARLAAPWTCLVVVLIAVPFGAPSGRRNVFVGVASSIFICFAYFVIQQLTIPLGVMGWMPTVLAGWLPNVVFGAVGLLLIAQPWRAWRWRNRRPPPAQRPLPTP